MGRGESEHNGALRTRAPSAGAYQGGSSSGAGSGAFLLAEAGLLAGKRVATQRAACDLLRQRALETTQQPIQQIAHSVGFGTTESMHRALKRRLSLTPGSTGPASRGQGGDAPVSCP